MYEIILIILSVGFAVLAWRDLRFALILLAGLLPSYLLRFSIGPIPSTLLEVFILISIFVWLTKHCGWRVDLRRVDPWTRAGLLLLAAASFSTVVATDTISAFGIWKAYFIEPFFIFMMMRALFTRADYYKALVALAVSSSLISLFAIFQFITGFGIPVPWDIERRVTGFFNYPNALGLFVAPVTSFTIVLATIKRGRKQILWTITAILGFVAILLAQTEAALVAIPAGLLIAFLFSDMPRSRKFALSGIATAVLVFALALPVTQSKLLLQDYSGEVRRAQWKESIQFVTDNPAFGAGLNGYATAISPYHDPTLYEIFQYPHNIILNIWTELGLLGIFVFFWLVVLTIKEMRRTNPNPIKLAAFAALATMTIHGFVDVPYFKNDLSVMTWIFIAILATTFDKEVSKR